MSFERRRCRFTCLAVILACAAAPAAADEPSSKSNGAVCIAGFKISDPTGPIMDLPGPGEDSKYTFRFDKQRDVQVGKGETRVVDGLPTDRRFLVELRLDGRRTEAFWIDFRKEDEPRVCLWLYEGYWHWAKTYADDLDRGCKCWPREAQPAS
jgi:hypothetical protein